MKFQRGNVQDPNIKCDINNIVMTTDFLFKKSKEELSSKVARTEKEREKHETLLRLLPGSMY